MWYLSQNRERGGVGGGVGSPPVLIFSLAYLSHSLFLFACQIEVSQRGISLA